MYGADESKEICTIPHDHWMSCRICWNGWSQELVVVLEWGRRSNTGWSGFFRYNIWCGGAVEDVVGLLKISWQPFIQLHC